jgi:hypothetical protein
MFATKIANWYLSESVSRKRDGVDTAQGIWAPPGVASGCLTERADRERMTAQAIKFFQPWRCSKLQAQYDRFVLHGSTSLFREGFGEFHNRQQAFQLEQPWRSIRVTIHIGPSLIGPISWHREGSRLGTFQDQTLNATYRP